MEIAVEEARMTVTLELETLLAGIDASQFQDTRDAPQAAEYDRFRVLPPEELETVLREEWEALCMRFVFEVEGAPDCAEIQSVAIPEVGDPELGRESTVELELELPPGEAPVKVGAARELGPLILRHVNAGDQAFAGLLSPGELSPPLPRLGGAAESASELFGRYIVIGIEHIVPKGLDHILFVLGLFFFALQMRPLLWQVTAFTVAHTVTLALASLGVVTVPAAIVEPLIAASIAYVAFENLRATDLSRWRTAIVFGFGLLHGLGFASVLGDIGLPQGQFLVSLVAFNIGVELGQLFVIAVAFVVLGLPFGKQPYYKSLISNPASLLIGLIGLWWVFERVFLA